MTLLRLDRQGWLLTLSLLYLALPYSIFFSGYLRLSVALFFLCALFAGAFLAIRNRSQERVHGSLVSGSGTSHIISWILLFLLLLGLVLISGVGGYGYQDEDWYKHNAILAALIDHPWPVTYSVVPADSPEHITHLPLVYYIAYYLPAACIGKIWGWTWANHALFLWTYLGLCLALLWFVLLLKRSPFLTGVFFLAFSGLDAVGLALLRKFLLQKPLYFSGWTHIERWSGNWQYPANVSSLFWVPNQAISGWIVCGLLFYVFLYTQERKHLVFVLSLTPLWSPFLTLGLLPFVLLDFFRGKKTFSKRAADYTSFSALCGILMFLILGLFYVSRFYDIPLPLSPIANGFIFSHSIVPGLFWYELLALLVLFLLLEFALYAWLIAKSGVTFEAGERRFFYTMIFVLTILPLFRYGFWNDLVMRASLPALFFLCLLTGQTVYASSAKKVVRLMLFVLLLVGSLNVFIEIKRHVLKTSAQEAFVQIPTPRALYEAPNTNVNPSFFTQYIGSAESPFFELLAKPLRSSGPVLAPSDLIR